jgi:hypothetical protein
VLDPPISRDGYGRGECNLPYMPKPIAQDQGRTKTERLKRLNVFSDDSVPCAHASIRCMRTSWMERLTKSSGPARWRTGTLGSARYRAPRMPSTSPYPTNMCSARREL